jgi:hypothetical protein
VALHGEVLLAAEGAAIADQFHGDAVEVPVEELGDLAAVVEDALPLAIHVKAKLAVALGRNGDGAFRLKEHVVDVLGLVLALDDVLGGGKAGGRIAAGDGGLGKEVALGVKLGRVGEEGILGAGDGLEDFVLDLDEGGGFAGDALCFRDDDGDGVALVVGLVADGDEDGPVANDEADEAFAGDVGGGEDALDAGDGHGGGGVDGEDAGAGMVAELERGEAHVLHEDVVYILPGSDGELAGAEAVEAGADEAALVVLGEGAAALDAGDDLDGVDDLHVAGAAAEVLLERVGDLGAGGFGVGGDEAERADGHAGNAEAALEATGAGEGLGDELAILLGDALEGDDVLAGDLADGEGAGEAGLAVDEDGAAAAVGLRGTAVLGGGDVAFLAEELEERGVLVDLDADVRAIEFEFHQLLCGRVDHAFAPGGGGLLPGRDRGGPPHGNEQ